MKIIKIKTDINNFLESITPNVFYGTADKDAKYPFVVFDLTNSTDDGVMERFILEIDGWDNNKDTTDLETMMSKIDKGLHRRTVVIDDIFLTFYRENRLTVHDDNPNLRRRQYVYQIRVHGE